MLSAKLIVSVLTVVVVPVTVKLPSITTVPAPADPPLSGFIFNVDADTLPTSTVTAVDKIIDPRASYPGDGTLPVADVGQRYLITENLDSEGWPNWGIDAGENDIVEYDGTKWIISFDASEVSEVKYVTNTNTTKQFKWYNNAWISSYEGVYNSGFWRLLL